MHACVVEYVCVALCLAVCADVGINAGKHACRRYLSLCSHTAVPSCCYLGSTVAMATIDGSFWVGGVGRFDEIGVFQSKSRPCEIDSERCKYAQKQCEDLLPVRNVFKPVNLIYINNKSKLPAQVNGHTEQKTTVRVKLSLIVCSHLNLFVKAGYYQFFSAI